MKKLSECEKGYRRWISPSNKPEKAMPVDTGMLHYRETQYGFEWGAASVTRGFSGDLQGWVTLLIDTPKHDLQIYVTKTGKVRVYDRQGEWKATSAVIAEQFKSALKEERKKPRKKKP